jgi:hypothetical protein
MKEIHLYVQQAVDNLALQVPVYSLPFPIRQNHSPFIIQLNQLLGSFKNEGLFERTI